MAPIPISKPGEDAFDSLDWDPDLSSVKSADESPEPVPITPQPVQPIAYTTVGSVVNPNLLPQLSAPNRIQREGANRRPLMSILQGLQPHSAQRRGPPPPLNMSNSMHYAQQLSARPSNPGNQNSFPRTFQPAIPNMEHEQATPVQAVQAVQGLDQNSLPMLSQQERDSLMMQYGTYNGVQSVASNASSPLKRSNLQQVSRHQTFNVKESCDEDARGRSQATAVQGLDRMQTLQRMAKFENPNQQYARERLSMFSATRAQPSSANPLGELNREYQFPPPGISGPSVPQSNPLLGPEGRGYQEAPPLPSRPYGYPQPLTAGPPGQRQARPSLITNTIVAQDNTAPSRWEGSDWYNSMGTHQASNTWGYQQAAQIPGQPTPVPVADLDKYNRYQPVKVVDTMPDTEAHKYFPYGLPPTFGHQYKQLSRKDQSTMDIASGLPERESSVSKEQVLDDWFYYGQRRMWGMSMDDHTEEMRKRLVARETTFGAFPPPPRKKFTESVIPRKVTAKEMDQMSVGEAAAPILGAAFGTLLSLHDKGIGSASEYSGFGEPDPDWVDSNPKANGSMFGEDWGRSLKFQGYVDSYKQSRSFR
ncbi:uncharacterized protein LY89DRAFT_152889 [Mollisia scopiformis]|uniref:Uncharacterized protein n=1 Tax=Mollisia scopiformis TaxID=149040 RepID=A0A194X1N5_MOLSC|nr:uncharacterized protein LY89DRAFT_152889 [Mollisia scopiformis]KUJ14103.1 hypothetical protein LY89DRAFT_152889 [Mollisia scopiformis]